MNIKQTKQTKQNKHKQTNKTNINTKNKQECYDTANFQGTMEMISALESSTVSRLHKTWEEIDKQHMTIYTELRNVFAFSGNYKNYRFEYQNKHK